MLQKVYLIVTGAKLLESVLRVKNEKVRFRQLQ
jgi:hypothetical protein